MICFDTQVTIWAVQSVPPPGGEELARLAKVYVRYLGARSIPIAIPAIVLGEYLVKIPERLRQNQEELFARAFQILPFDAPTAAFAARILGRKEELRAASDCTGNPLQRIKVDALIVATALRHRVETLISHDDGIIKLANLVGLKTEKIPDRSLPVELPSSPQKTLFPEEE